MFLSLRAMYTGSCFNIKIVFPGSEIMKVMIWLINDIKSTENNSNSYPLNMNDSMKTELKGGY